MYSAVTPEAPCGASQAPLAPFPVPGKVRYGLMNGRGMYFVHAYRSGGRWSEWAYESHDAHTWVDVNACAAAAKTWHTIKGEPLTVILL